MTSPNFRPQDVKVGTIVKLDNGEKHVVVSLEGLEGDYFEKAILGDGSELWLDQMFPVVTGKYRGATRVEVVDNRLIVRLNAIEERLTKLEGSAVKVEFDGGPKKIDPAKCVGVIDEVFDKSMLPTSPKVCPVTGMFLEEPVDKLYHYADGLSTVNISWNSELRQHKTRFISGNCFATREDAERYAKNLKVMAKLRRLGGVKYVDMITIGWGEEKALKTLLINEKLEQLTPEEQNALMWPNEEK